MENFQILVLCLAFATVSCNPTGNPQSRQASEPTIQDVLLGTPLGSQQESSVTTHYPYQTNNLTPSSIFQVANPSGSSYGNRDVQQWNPNTNVGESMPYFGISAGMDYLFSAYIGPVVWAMVCIMALFGGFVASSRLLTGSDFFGFFQASKEAASRSLDLDNVTRIVHQALDAYMDKEK